MSASICLSMIIRYTEPALADCLALIKDHIDSWVIVDTTVASNNREIIDSVLSGLNGEYHTAVFEHYSQSRNLALSLAQSKADYLLLLDPDMLLDIKSKSALQKLSLDAYYIPTGGDIRVQHYHLISTRINWQYSGATFEVLASDDGRFTSSQLAESSITRKPSPSNTKLKQEDDLQVLNLLVSEYPDDAHALFYLAKMQLEKHDWAISLTLFERFIQLQPQVDPEWIWYALYSRARLLEQQKVDEAQLVDAYLQAYEYRPQRIEPLFELARLYRKNKRPALARLYARETIAEANIPASERFDLNLKVYNWQRWSDYAIACSSINDHRGVISGANTALRLGTTIRNQRDTLLALRRRHIGHLFPADKSIDRLNNIRLLIPFRNASDYLADCIATIQTQNYTHFTATFIDDDSDDASADLVPVDDKRFNLIQNAKRVGPLVNRLNFILSCDPDDIIFYLDGDDQLASDQALSRINEIYNQTDCWMTYGQYLSQNGTIGYAQPYVSQQHLISELESGDMRFPIHPITHRAGLLHRLKEHDPNLRCYKDDSDDWLFWASDAVLARPLFYMAGIERIHYCDEVLYLYTEGHEISESINNKKDQIETCRLITKRLKPPLLSSIT